MLTTQRIPSYIELLRTIGIPGLIEGTKGPGSEQLMKLAQLNKIALLYSSVLSDDFYQKDLLPKYQLLMDTLKDVSRIFSNSGIQYSIFKTIKPFPTTPSDVDVLLRADDFGRAEGLLLSAGYKRTASDDFSSTLEREMIVDLQLQPSVSNLPYLSSAFFMQNTILKSFEGFDIHTLDLEAEAIVTASHSFYKEQMFTLNDYYTITLLVEQLDISKLIKLASDNNVTDVLNIITGICSQLTESVFQTRLKVNTIGEKLGLPPPQLLHDSDLPMKFPFGLVFRLLIDRASKDKDMRRTIVPALLRLASPRQLAKLVSHMRRKTY